VRPEIEFSSALKDRAQETCSTMTLKHPIVLTALAALFPCASLQAQHLLVIEKGTQSLAIVDPASGKKVASAPETGITGHEVAASPDGKYAYVPIYGNSGVGKPGTDGSEIDTIDLATRQVVGTLKFTHGIRPHDPVIGPKDHLLYVTTELDKTITVIDPSNPKALKIVGTIPTGSTESHMLALSHDGKRGYTANVGPGTVSVIDIPNRKVITTIPISKMTQRISISNDDKYVFTSDQTKPQLAVIDTATNKVTKWIPLPSSGYGTASTPDGRWLLVDCIPSKQVVVIDLKTLTVAHTIDVPAHPQELLVNPNNKVAYTSCDSTNQVAEIDLKTWKVARLIPISKNADGLAWASK
jgi:YVTN family beta-propeller protein